jgi:endonuclease/exonuclease/phosphatase family metal-dependent hydrolase
MHSRGYLVRNLSSYRTLAELHESAFFRECRAEIAVLLERPVVEPCAAPEPGLGAFLRVAAWNIEKGKQLARIIELLRCDPVLRWADVVLLNEVDTGMIRSGNLDIGLVIAQELRMHRAFGPAHLELTKGTERELELSGENAESLQGNAVLSRYPILDARNVPLPVCFEPYEFHEKRFGRRSCLWTRIGVPGRNLWIGATHLEVRDTPACRGRQMGHIVSHFPGSPSDACLLGGDFNSSGFPRGSSWRTVRSVSRLMIRSPESMRDVLRHPERGSEPLFRVARRSGFVWDGLNSYSETACTPLGGLEDAAFLPGSIAAHVRRRLSAYNGYLQFKLDWFLGKGLVALRAGELRDPVTGVHSVDPGSVALPAEGEDRISDHRPIYVDLRIPV